MSCDEFRERVPDVVDAGPDDPIDETLGAHLRTCPACRALVDDLRRVRDAAAALDRPAPPPDLWPRIAHCLSSDEEFGARVAGRTSQRRPVTWVWLAAAAALVLAVGASLWTVGRSFVAGTTPSGPETHTGTSAAPGNATPGAIVESIEQELQLAAGHYEKAIAGLEQVANASDAPLDPAVMATLRQNLATIDAAIDESRVALKAQPENRLAQESLFEAFRRKIALLQDTIALMNEMRKGDQAGAARVVESVNKS